MAGLPGLYEAQRVLAKSTLELGTAIVRERGCLGDGLPDSDARARWKILGTDVQFDEEIVAKERQVLTVRDQACDIGTHHGQLAFGISRGSTIPAVPGHAFFPRESRLA